MAHKKNQIFSNEYELERKLIAVQKSTGTAMPGFIRLHNWLRMHSKLYYWWHTHTWSRGTHWCVVVVMIILCGGVIAGVIGALLALNLSGIYNILPK